MSEESFENLRQQMLAEIEAEAALTAGHTGRPAFSERVMRVVGGLPRHEFVPVELQPYAYLNRPLPIGYEKTVSQPFIVATICSLRHSPSGIPGSIKRRAPRCRSRAPSLPESITCCLMHGILPGLGVG